jgi:hypothetical protein
VDFLRGDVATTPRLILAMLRNLPEGSRYVAAISSAPEVADAPPSDTPAEDDPSAELRVWTQDRMLMAQLINSVNVLVRYSINWEQGKAPKLPLVGPSSWSGDKGNKPAKPLSVMDVLNKITGTTHG